VICSRTRNELRRLPFDSFYDREFMIYASLFAFFFAATVIASRSVHQRYAKINKLNETR
jgi:hypothetical protein